MTEFAEAFEAADRGSKALYNCLTKGFVTVFSCADSVAFGKIFYFDYWVVHGFDLVFVISYWLSVICPYKMRPTVTTVPQLNGLRVQRGKNFMG